MTVLRVAAVQASYVLMDRDATIDRVAALTGSAAREGAQVVVFPEVFVPGTPVWIGTQPIWDGDEEWFGLLAENAVVVGGPARDRLLAPGYLEQNGPWLEEGNTVVVAPDGSVIAGPVREREETLIADLDLRTVATARRHMDPVGHYHRPDIFRLNVDTSPRPAVTEPNRRGDHDEDPV
jgi:predicted amidohydrolase